MCFALFSLCLPHNRRYTAWHRWRCGTRHRRHAAWHRWRSWGEEWLQNVYLTSWQPCWHAFHPYQGLLGELLGGCELLAVLPVVWTVCLSVYAHVQTDYWLCYRWWYGSWYRRRYCTRHRWRCSSARCCHWLGGWLSKSLCCWLCCWLCESLRCWLCSCGLLCSVGSFGSLDFLIASCKE